MSKGEYKKYVKSKIKDAAMEYLKQLQGKHTKINHIKYDELKTQEYMLSPIFSNEEVMQIIYWSTSKWSYTDFL